MFTEAERLGYTCVVLHFPGTRLTTSCHGRRKCQINTVDFRHGICHCPSLPDLRQGRTTKTPQRPRPGTAGRLRRHRQSPCPALALRERRTPDLPSSNTQNFPGAKPKHHPHVLSHAHVLQGAPPPHSHPCVQHRGRSSRSPGPPQDPGRRGGPSSPGPSHARPAPHPRTRPLRRGLGGGSLEEGAAARLPARGGLGRQRPLADGAELSPHWAPMAARTCGPALRARAPFLLTRGAAGRAQGGSARPRLAASIKGFGPWALPARARDRSSAGSPRGRGPPDDTTKHPHTLTEQSPRAKESWL